MDGGVLGVGLRSLQHRSAGPAARSARRGHGSPAGGLRPLLSEPVGALVVLAVRRSARSRGAPEGPPDVSRMRHAGDFPASGNAGGFAVAAPAPFARNRVLSG